MDSGRRGDRLPDRSHQAPSFNPYRRETYNRQTDQHTSTSSDSNPARPLGQARDNERKQDQKIPKLKQLVDNIQQVNNDIQQILNDFPQREKDIERIKGEWEKHNEREKVISGPELEQFGKKVEAAMAELKTLSSTLTGLKNDLKANVEEYRSNPLSFLNPEVEAYAKKRDSEILSMEDPLTLSHLPDLLKIHMEVIKERRQQHRVMEYYRPWMSLDEMFKNAVDNTLKEKGVNLDIARKIRKYELEMEYKKFRDDKLQKLSDGSEISIYNLIKN